MAKLTLLQRDEIPPRDETRLLFLAAHSLSCIHEVGKSTSSLSPTPTLLASILRDENNTSSLTPTPALLLRDEISLAMKYLVRTGTQSFLRMFLFVPMKRTFNQETKKYVTSILICHPSSLQSDEPVMSRPYGSEALCFDIVGI